MISPTRRALRLLLPTLLLAACDNLPAAEPTPPPLKPLIYTESAEYTPDFAQKWEDDLLRSFEATGRLQAQPAEDQAAPAADPGDDIIEQDLPPAAPAAPAPRSDELDLSSPDGTAAAAFQAILRQDRATFDRLLIDQDGLKTLTGVGATTAERRIAALQKAAYKAWSTFSPGNASEEPVGGLAAKLTMTEVRLGTPGDVRGKKPRDEADTVQYWGTEIAFALTAEPQGDAAPYTFTLTLPRLLKLPSGEWRIAAAPQVGSPFLTYLDAGIHLKPELLQPEHHEFPLSVGNFWRYRVTWPERDTTSDEPLPPLEDLPPETVQIEVTEVVRFDGYRVATLRRTHTAEKAETSLFYLLVTPRRLYHCDRYCKTRSEDLDYVLDHIRLSTPLLIFPLRENVAWTKGGKIVFENARYNAQEQREAAQTPAGTFTDTIVVQGRTSSGVEIRYFKPGLGVVKRILRGNTGTRAEELIEYRVLNTE